MRFSNPGAEYFRRRTECAQALLLFTVLYCWLWLDVHVNDSPESATSPAVRRMIRIEPSVFVMGLRTEKVASVKSRCTALVFQPYFIDTHEVTVGDFAEFLRGTAAYVRSWAWTMLVMTVVTHRPCAGSED